MRIEDEKKKRSIDEMFGEDSDSDDDQIRQGKYAVAQGAVSKCMVIHVVLLSPIGSSVKTTADASGSDVFSLCCCLAQCAVPHEQGIANLGDFAPRLAVCSVPTRKATRTKRKNPRKQRRHPRKKPRPRAPRATNPRRSGRRPRPRRPSQRESQRVAVSLVRERERANRPIHYTKPPIRKRG